MEQKTKDVIKNVGILLFFAVGFYFLVNLGMFLFTSSTLTWLLVAEQFPDLLPKIASIFAGVRFMLIGLAIWIGLLVIYFAGKWILAAFKK